MTSLSRLRNLTNHQAKYIAHDLTLQHSCGGIDRLGQALFNARVDLNPNKIEAAVCALRSPLLKGVLSADKVGSPLRCDNSIGI
jgi:hypothetical protein